jgi:ABC-type hemin transport system substrate-binding protein
VISLTPVASSFVVDLGAAELVVGVDLASSTLPALRGLPVLDLGQAQRLSPDLVIVGRRLEGDPAVAVLRGAGVDVLEFAPHDLEDLLALVRDLGGRLVGRARAAVYERDLSRPMAAIAGDSFGQIRPRVVAVVAFDPLEVASGHSFETDLIEIAGGTSVTHEAEQPTLQIEKGSLRDMRPDLILVVGAREPTAQEKRVALQALPPGPRVEFFTFDRERFWLQDADGTALRLRQILLRTLPGADQR